MERSKTSVEFFGRVLTTELIGRLAGVFTEGHTGNVTSGDDGGITSKVTGGVTEGLKKKTHQLPKKPKKFEKSSRSKCQRTHPKLQDL